MTERDRLTPSLLEPQSRGGDIAAGGFEFQDHLILARIPIWLAQEGFTAMAKESIGDVEAKFFVLDRGFVKELIEVKDHVLQPAEFWSEIRRFRQIDSGSPNTYRIFTLIGTGASKELQPIINQLDRVRNSQDFYDSQDGVQQNSIQAYIQLAESKGATKQEAQFLLQKVTIETDWNTVKPHGEAVFKQNLAELLEEYRDLPLRILDDIYNHLGTFLRQRGSRLISRKELEKKLREKVPTQHQPSFRPIQIYTAISPQDNPDHPGLRFDWTDFSGGDTRAIAPPERWDELSSALQNTRTWIENYRNTQRIRLLGNRRVSACLAIGATFSAVRGYAIEMHHRNEIWATDAYPTAETPSYPISHQFMKQEGNCLVVSISIGANALPAVRSQLDEFNLSAMPLLEVLGEQPVTSPAQANSLAGSLKRLVVEHLQSANCHKIHLFYAGPAHIALFLGHRLDATAPICCYGWSEGRRYSQTCQLFS